MVKKDAQKIEWVFPARFRKGAYSWKSTRLAAQRIRQAVTELKKAFRKDPVAALEGSVRFLEKLVPAIEHVDSSSGALGSAVNNSIHEILELHRKANVSDDVRAPLLDRLWNACMDDEISYLDPVLASWGEFCVSKTVASKYADKMVPMIMAIWQDHPGGWIKGTDAAFSSLLAAGRHSELLEHIRQLPNPGWHFTNYGVKALLAEGRIEDARGFASIYNCQIETEVLIGNAEEQAMIDSGEWEEAYRRFGLRWSGSGTYLSAFQAIVKRYPTIDPERILNDLIASTPHDPGRWFASAKHLGLLDTALSLAQNHSCDPRTLIRASKDLCATHPSIAWKLSLAAIRWIVAGRGYDITSGDLLEACNHALNASEDSDEVDEMGREFRTAAAGESQWAHAARAQLGRLLAFPECRRSSGVRRRVATR